jgi:hypothetical protein
MSTDLYCATRLQVHPLSGPTAKIVRLLFNGINHYEQMVLHVPGAPAPAPRADAAAYRPAPALPKERRVRARKQPYTPAEPSQGARKTDQDALRPVHGAEGRLEQARARCM